MSATQRYSEPEYVLRARSSQTLEVLAHITDFESASWAHELYGLGEFEIALQLDDALLDWAVDEGIFEVIRDGVLEFVGIVDDMDFDDETGAGSVVGIDLRALLAWRSIYPPDGAEEAQDEDVASQVIRNYIIANLTSGAASGRNINNHFNGPELLVEDASIGSTVSRSERYSELLGVAFEIAQAGGIFFLPETVAGPDYQISFYEYTDKTATVRLSTPLGTALKLGVANRWRDHVNAVRIVGEGEGDDEVIYDDDDVGTLSPYRRERVESAAAPTRASIGFDDLTQFYTDFSEYPNGGGSNDSIPEFVRRWDVDSMNANVRSSGLPSGTTGGKALELNGRGAGDPGLYALSSALIGVQSEPMEMQARVQFEIEQDDGILLILAGAGSDGAGEDAYVLALHGDPAREWSIVKLASGAVSDLFDDDSPNIQDDTWYRVRFRRSGEFVQAKVWQSSEPELWTEVEDNAFDSGWMGVGRWDNTGLTDSTWFDWISFGIEGDPAPAGPLAPQTVTIGARTYTFSPTVSSSNTVLRALSGATMARNLAAAINADEDTEGEWYGSGTSEHSDVYAIADGGTLSIFPKDTGTRIELDSDLSNGEWDVQYIGAISEEAAMLLENSAERVRTYTVLLDQAMVRYRADVELGDIVTAYSERLATEDQKLVASVSVTLDQDSGESVQMGLGVPPLSVFDTIGEQGKDIRRLKIR